MKSQMPNVSDRLDLAVLQELEDLKQHPCSPDWRLCGRNQSWIVAETMTLSGDHASAAQAATEMATDFTEQWQESYDAACIMARCVALVRNDEKLPPRERERIGKSYCGHAVRFLRSAINHGFHEFGMLEKDPDLAPLRGDTSFKRVLTTAQRAAG